jgi:hypothetical protein
MTTKVDKVQVKLADGSTRTLQIHSVTQIEFLGFMDELDIKNFSELTAPPPNLQAMRMMQRVAASALTFGSDQWTMKRIQKSLADLEQIAHVFNAVLAISDNLRGPGGVVKPAKSVEKSGVYG